MVCTRCNQMGFLNTTQIEPEWFAEQGFITNDTIQDCIRRWIEDTTNQPHDIVPCDCCDGSGEHVVGDETWSNGRVPDCI